MGLHGAATQRWILQRLHHKPVLVGSSAFHNGSRRLALETYGSRLKKSQLFTYMLEGVVAVPGSQVRIVERRGISYTFAQKSVSLADA
jgi:hypothetical protein